MYSLMFAEALKNLEMADFSLKNSLPFIQLIDAPIAPLSSEKTPYTKNLIIGAILGMLIAIGFIVSRKIYRDAINET
jgi:uncharacterized protein involved in exopolysaccharide biosynthesis